MTDPTPAIPDVQIPESSPLFPHGPHAAYRSLYLCQPWGPDDLFFYLPSLKDCWTTRSQLCINSSQGTAYRLVSSPTTPGEFDLVVEAYDASKYGGLYELGQFAEANNKYRPAHLAKHNPNVNLPLHLARLKTKLNDDSELDEDDEDGRLVFERLCQSVSVPRGTRLRPRLRQYQKHIHKTAKKYRKCVQEDWVAQFEQRKLTPLALKSKRHEWVMAVVDRLVAKGEIHAAVAGDYAGQKPREVVGEVIERREGGWENVQEGVPCDALLKSRKDWKSPMPLCISFN